MAIIVKNNPPQKKEEPKKKESQKIGSISAKNIQIKNNNKILDAKVEIKPNPSNVSVQKKDGTIIKRYPHNLFINDEKIEMNNKLNEMINKIIKEV